MNPIEEIRKARNLYARSDMVEPVDAAFRIASRYSRTECEELIGYANAIGIKFEDISYPQDHLEGDGIVDIRETAAYFIAEILMQNEYIWVTANQRRQEFKA